MGSHPINLLVRFLLEVAALISLGIWGWNQVDGWPQFILATAVPILIATIWVVFNVPNDPSRSGSAPIKTPGIIRLLIEFCVFGLGFWSLYDLGYTKISLFLIIITILHYLISYDRMKWLLSQQ